MYTVDDDKKFDEYEENEVQSWNFWQQNKDIIIKLLIIIACIIILIILFKALKTSKTVVYDEKIHNTNISNVRLAAEDYFFVKKNLPKDGSTSEVTIAKLTQGGLIKEVVDANNKVCDIDTSVVSLLSDKDVYKLTIKLNCSTKEKEEIFYYSKANGACLNCNGKTLVNGNINNNDTEKTNTSEFDYSKYSCQSWTDWSSNKMNDPLLAERTRTLYKGVKLGGYTEQIEYGEWSTWSTNLIEANDNTEVETKVENEEKWSSEKTSVTALVESDKLKVIRTEQVAGSSTTSCPSGYQLSNKTCISKTKYTSDLTYKQYNSGSYQIENKPCEAVNTEKDENGNYIWVYKNCQYRKITSTKKSTSSAYTIYVYQELESVPVTYYRYRSKSVVNVKEKDIYTDNYYEENNLPSGYQKDLNNIKTEYSYKLSVCEK